MSRIFISHSGKDIFEALAFRDWLAKEGWAVVFLDLDPRRDGAAAERWSAGLRMAAARCEAVIFLISGNWLEANWLHREFLTAHALYKTLIGVIVHPLTTDLPPELDRLWKIIDLTAKRGIPVYHVLASAPAANCSRRLARAALTPYTVE